MVEKAPFGLVSVKKEVYIKIARDVMKFADPSEPFGNWREVYGVLGGRIHIGTCYITDCKTMNIGTQTDVGFTTQNYIDAALFEEELRKKDERQHLVGWFHSHFIGLEYSGVDIMNHLGWQNDNNPFAIGLVFDPQHLSKENPGFAILKLKDYNLGDISPVESVDFVITIPKDERDDYLAYLKKNLSF